jgi:hypothetical protein
MKPPSLKAVLFGLIPYVAMCLSVPLWDRVHPMVLGLPFNLFWIVLWTVLTPLCLWRAYQIERPRLKGTGMNVKGDPR